MPKPRTLEHAPIKEAVLEVLFDFPYSEETSRAKINEYRKLVLSKYPIGQSIFEFNANVSTDENKNRFERKKIGSVHYSADKKSFIQTRINGFCYGQSNQSYKSWDLFRPVAFQELLNFVDYMQPIGVKRISLRFINEIRIPSTSDLKDHFNFLPSVETINLPIRNFLNKIEFEDHKIGATAVITQLLRPPIVPDINIYLDIDVIINLNIQQVDVPLISSKFEDLRNLKNYIFFSALKETTIESYQ